MRPIKSVLPIVCFAWAVAISARPAVCGESGPVVEVKLLSNGGEINAEPARDPINVQFTQGLTRFLTDLADGRYVVYGPGSGTVTKRKRPRFILEGEITQVVSPASDRGAYLCSLSLYGRTVNKKLRLRDRWIGAARSYLDLAGNISNDSRVDRQGLLGGLANRISDDITSDYSKNGSDDFERFVASASQSHRMSVQVEPEHGEPISASGAVSLKAGQSFRFQVATKDSGTAYVIAVDSRPQLISSAVPNQEQGTKVPAGQSVLVPSRASFPVGNTANCKRLRYVVLVRRDAPDTPNLGTLSNPRAAAAFVLSRIENPNTTADDGTLPAVRILDLGNTPLAHSPCDPWVTQLLQRATTDPAGTWDAQSIIVTVAPNSALYSTAAAASRLK